MHSNLGSFILANGVVANWRCIVNSARSLIIYDDYKIPYAETIDDLIKYASDLLFVRKNLVDDGSPSRRNFKVIENTIQNGVHQPRAVQISILKRKGGECEKPGPTKTPKGNDECTEHMDTGPNIETSENHLPNEAVSFKTPCTDENTESVKTSSILGKGVKIMKLFLVNELIEKYGRLLKL